MKDQQQDQIQRSLRDSESALDESIIKDLERARKYALQQATHTPKRAQANKFYPVTAVRFVAASILLTCGLIFIPKFFPGNDSQPITPMPLLQVDDINSHDFTTDVSEEELEIYEDLEFYVWLAESNYSG